MKRLFVFLGLSVGFFVFAFGCVSSDQTTTLSSSDAITSSFTSTTISTSSSESTVETTTTTLPSTTTTDSITTTASSTSSQITQTTTQSTTTTIPTTTTTIPTTVTTTTIPTTTSTTTTIRPLIQTTNDYETTNQDLIVPITWNGYDFVSLTGQAIQSANFEVLTGGVSISHRFLNQLASGDYSFTIRIGAFDLSFTIQVTQTLIPQILTPEGFVYQEDSIASLEIDINIRGIEKVEFFLNNAGIEPLWNPTTQKVTLSASVLSTLAFGSHTLKVKTVGGEASYAFIVNDKITLLPKTDFIKFPGEVVVNENFHPYIVNQVGQTTVEFILESGEGGLVDHGNGTFDFTPNAVYAGVVLITMKVQDEYAQVAEKTYELTYKTVNPIIYDAIGLKVVNKATSFGSVIMTVDTFGSETNQLYFEMVRVELNDHILTNAEAIFKVQNNPRLFAIDKDYLFSLPVGLHTFTLYTTAGRAIFTIEVRDTRAIAVSQNAFVYRKTVSTEAISFQVTPYEHLVTSSSFKLNEAVFPLEAFLWEDNHFTLLIPFLESLQQGDYLITINGTHVVTLTIQDPTAPIVSVASKKIVINKSTLEDNVSIGVELFDLENETQLIRNQAVNLSNYEILLDEIILHQSYLLSLPYGIHVFTIENSNGSDTFELWISDHLSYPTYQNVTKFTFETISNEPLRVSAQSPFTIQQVYLHEVLVYDEVETPVGSFTVATIEENQIVASGAFGVLTFNPATKQFHIDRAKGWFGVVVFTYFAVDSAGIVSSPITMDVVFKPMNPVISSPTNNYYVLESGIGSEFDLTYTITNAISTFDFPIYKIMFGSIELIKGVDYVVNAKSGSNRSFTLNASWLANQSAKTHTLSVYTEGGKATIAFTNYLPLSVDSGPLIFDKASLFDYSIVFSGYTIPMTQVKYGNQVLTTNEYTFSMPDSVVRLHRDYLASLPYGTHSFEFFNAVSSVVVLVLIDDSRTAIKLTPSSTYTVSSLTNVMIEFELYNQSFDGILYEGLAIHSSNYKFEHNTLTLFGPYLESISAGKTELIFTFLSTPNIEILITIHVETILPDILQIDSLYIDYANDVEVLFDLKGLSFGGIKWGATLLTSGVDYLFHEAEQVVILFASTLLHHYSTNPSSLSYTLLVGDNQNIGFVIPTPNAQNRILNGGFETGDLLGITSYRIWKNEPGMASMVSERVIHTTYFNQYPYHRDGEYNLGIVWPGAAWDQSSERMGHLVFRPFVLGGSGWISFKLGGGQISAFSYLSVRKASDHSEVARFGNPFFNNTTQASLEYGSPITNAEAFLFQYYVDLSVFVELGTMLYLSITEAAAYDFAILSVDSLYTYHANTPDVSQGSLAISILPTILNIDSATNTIKNGSFDQGLTDWTQDQNAWFVEGGVAKSNALGDASMGVLRSSAFVIMDKPYLRFDWAGGLRYDKQIFVSIKEVGTNFEVLRFVVRSNLFTKESANFDNHMLDLTSLSQSKVYYLEFSDNRSGSWGVSFIDSIRFVNQSEWNSVTSGDRAVMISHIPSQPIYQNP